MLIDHLAARCAENSDHLSEHGLSVSAETDELKERLRERYDLNIDRGGSSSVTVEEQNRDITAKGLYETNSDLCCRIAQSRTLCKTRLTGYDGVDSGLAPGPIADARRHQNHRMERATTIWSKIHPLANWTRVARFGTTSSNTTCLTIGYTTKGIPASVAGLARGNCFRRGNMNAAGVGAGSKKQECGIHL